MITRLASICERNELFTRFCTVCPVICRGRRKYNFGSRRVYSGPNCVPIRNWIKNREQFVARKRSKSRLVLGWRPALSFSWKKIIVCTQPLHFSKLDPVDLISVFWYQGKTFSYHISKWHFAHHVDFDLNESRFPLATLRLNKQPPFNIVFFCCCMGHTQQASLFQRLVMPIFAKTF